MLSHLFLSLFIACLTPKNNPPPEAAVPQSLETSPADNSSVAAAVDVPPMVEWDSTTTISNVVVVDADGNRINALEATEGTYQMLAQIRVSDSSGDRTEDMPVGDVSLVQNKTLVVTCVPTQMDEQTITIDCQATEK